jgi:hypothetical protein
MLTKQQRAQQRGIVQHKREALNALIREQVIHILGEPDCLLLVQVCGLWADYYRVHVLIGNDIPSTKIANSYFLEADSEGNIVQAKDKRTIKVAS